MHVEAVRVYYDRASGEVVHIHRLVSPAGEQLDQLVVGREVDAFAASIRQRHTRDLEVLEVEEEDLNRLLSGGGRLTVAREDRRLTAET
jgi:hypothetical protein